MKSDKERPPRGGNHARARNVHSPEPTANDTAQSEARQRDLAAFLFEQDHGSKTWCVQLSDWNGRRRLQVWPWYRTKESSELRPCAAQYGGGFAIPMDRVPELIAALQSVVER